MQNFTQRLVETRLAQLEDEALKKGDPVAYMDAAINRRMATVVGIAKAEGWGAWKRNAVCKYIRTMLQGMSRVEMVATDSDSIEEMVDHAAEGFDQWRARRLR